LREDVYRGAQQDDAIELGVELHLILFASGYEQYIGVLSGQQRLDGVLTPPLAAIGLRLAPSASVSTALWPSAASSAIRPDFPVTDIPVISTRLTGRAYAAVTQSTLARA
jgi:hypothetical protein